MLKEKKRIYAALGYSQLDTAEIVLLLNKLLANYTVYFQKLRNFHWNVTGQDFFDLHNKFEQMYSEAIEDSDKVAERIRLFGLTPVSTLRKCIETSAIKETDEIHAPYEMAKILINDIRTLLEIIDSTITAADDIHDSGTEYMLKEIMFKLEKNHWMLSSWLKQHV